MRNMLAEDIALAEGKSQYDAQCKKVLSNRTILAWILKRTVQECQELSVSQIKACICGEPEVSNVRVEPGRTNRLPEQVVGDANEDSSRMKELFILIYGFTCSFPPGEKQRLS